MTPDQTLAAVREAWKRITGCVVSESSQGVYQIRIRYPDLQTLQDAHRAMREITQALIDEPSPPEPGKLPMVLGRHPKIGIEQSTGMYVVSYSHDVLDSSGRWVHWSRKTNADKHPTREAAEQFVRDCAAREANGRGEMLGVSGPSQPETPDSPPPADLHKQKCEVGSIAYYEAQLERLREGLTFVITERDKLLADVERLTRERDEARKPPTPRQCEYPDATGVWQRGEGGEVIAVEFGKTMRELWYRCIDERSRVSDSRHELTYLPRGRWERIAERTPMPGLSFSTTQVQEPKQ